jgi:hypothetical protein
MRGIGELRVSKIDNLIENFIDEDEVFADCLLVDDPAEILDNGHDAIEQL